MKKRILLFSFLGALLIAVIFRVYALINLLEYETGFVKRESKTAYGVLFFLTVALAVAVCLFALSSGPVAEKKKHFSLTGTVFTFLLGVATASEPVTSIFTGVPSAIKVAFVVLSYVTAAYFILLAVRPFVHFKLSPKFAVLPICLFTVKAATVFITTSYHAVISDTVLNVIIYCLSMLFFLELARAVNGAGGKRSVHKITAFGLLVSFFAITSSVPKILLGIFFGEALHESASSAFLPLFLGLYIASLVFSRVSFSSGGDLKFGVYYAGKH